MSCLSDYLDAVDEADKDRNDEIEACGSDNACVLVAIKKHADRIVAAKDAYNACIGGGGGPQS